MKLARWLPFLALTAGLTACQKQPPASDEPTETEVAEVKETGRAAASALMKSLGGQLKGALESGGPVTALQVCQQAAGPMTTAAGESFEDATIRRTTLKPRNPANAPDELDRKVLEELAAAEELPAEHLEWTGGTGRFYKPLVIQEVCLKCHGDPAGFSPELADTLAKLYPEDQATGYALGDFRGVIRVDIER